MQHPGFDFQLHHTDAGSAARRATLVTPRGAVQTPAFMPVGTQGTVKGLDAPAVAATGAEMILANTYHLALRPGDELIAELGGLHEFMGWSGPILTDSGGFQLFSLAERLKVSEEGAVFQSHIDGSRFELTPEGAIAIQERLGSDIAMVLDHVVRLPAEPELVVEATERTVRWARRAKEAASDSFREKQIQFAIVQGGLDADLRRRCADELVAIGFFGYAIGGLSVGETPGEMYAVLDALRPALPEDAPRYLMGVGRPIDLLEAVHRGVDLFDCVMPTRNGRNALAFTAGGPLRLRNEAFRRDARPLEADCPCPACQHSRAYLRHLFMAREMLGPVLLSAHNLTYYQRLLAGARAAIQHDRFGEYYQDKLRGWNEGAD